MNIGGYAGKQLRVYLNKKKVYVENINSKIICEFLGGVGYAAKILYDELGENIDPLGANNKIIFATGPLTNGKVPGGGSIEVCFKSPLTNTWSESRCGGNFGPELKKAGYDFIIVEGKSEEPVYLVINNDYIKFKTAVHLKGKNTSEKENIIRKELDDPKYSIMSIGPAGENLVKFSTIMQEGRAAGRGGAGAVMGSKNLLAIAVRGSEKLIPYNSAKFKESIKEVFEIITNNPDCKSFKEHGTTIGIATKDELGDFPTKNWQSNSWGKGKDLYNYFYKNNLLKNKSCYKGCPLACARFVEVKNGKYKTPPHDGGEYESIAAFTSFVFNENMDTAVYSAYLCDEYGIDTISTGAVIAFAMECYEKGIIGKKLLDGLDLTWGNSDVLPLIVTKIAKREGIGNLLAEGVKIVSDELGEKTKDFAIHGKGLEAPAHDPRSGKALAVAYGTGNRGMCHIHPVEAMNYDYGKLDFGLIPYGLKDPNEVDRWDEIGKGKAVKLLQDGCILPDILGVCKFFIYFGVNIDHYAKILSSLTGFDVDGEKLLKIGERTFNLQKLINTREGFNKKDDEIPERMKKMPLFGKYKDQVECEIKDYSLMLREYYRERGWDVDTGVPKEAKLKELGILK